MRRLSITYWAMARTCRPETCTAATFWAPRSMAQNSARRERRDHIHGARAILEAGARLDRREIDGCGVEAMTEMLEDWAEAHPDRVVDTG